MAEWKLTNRKGEGRNEAWLRAHVDYRYEDCLKWPWGKDSHGYGQLKFEGKIRKAHRVMCELIRGPSPGPTYEAAHSCGRGHQACINPRHISWKTRSQNQRDRTDSYGKSAPKHKLTEEDVALIRTLFATETNLAIARRFDVTPGLISKIKNGWLWTPERKRIFVPLNDDQIREIRTLFGKKPVREIAEMYGVSEGKIQHIKLGNAHGYVP